MSDTTTTDAMTANEIFQRISGIRTLLGPKAYVSADIAVSGYRSSGTPVGVHAYPDGVCANNSGKIIYGATWTEALTEAETWAKSYAPTQRNALIRRMALAVIEITDEHGTCTERLLRAKSFSADEIRDTHVAACERAGEMAGNAPFSVVLEAA